MKKMYCEVDGHNGLNASRLRRKLEIEANGGPAIPYGTYERKNGVKVNSSGGAKFETNSPRLVALMTGELDVSELDDEELARGYPKGRKGDFAGRPPKMIPLILHKQIQKEFTERVESQMRVAIPLAIEKLAAIAVEPGRDDKDSLKAIDMLMNRIFGKPQERVQVTSGEQPFEVALGKMRRSPANGRKPAAPAPTHADSTEDDE